MKIYLAQIRQNKDIDEEALRKIENALSSYAYKDAIQIDRSGLPRILIDSGAFTAFTTGKVIKLEEYAEWAIAFRKKWEPLVRSLHFFNLDVIGDEEISDKNLIRLEKMGLNPLPIFTYKGNIKYLKKYLNYPYLGFGGVVGVPKKDLIAWFDYCFKFVSQHKRKTGILPRIHLLGITKEDILSRYPAYSADSSSWVKCLRFGGGDAIGKKKIPRYNDSPEALEITKATLRAEIRKYQEMEQRLTKLWASRGIVFDD